MTETFTFPAVAENVGVTVSHDGIDAGLIVHGAVACTAILTGAPLGVPRSETAWATGVTVIVSPREVHQIAIAQIRFDAKFVFPLGARLIQGRPDGTAVLDVANYRASVRKCS